MRVFCTVVELSYCYHTLLYQRMSDSLVYSERDLIGATYFVREKRFIEPC